MVHSWLIIHFFHKIFQFILCIYGKIKMQDASAMDKMTTITMIYFFFTFFFLMLPKLFTRCIYFHLFSKNALRLQVEKFYITFHWSLSDNITDHFHELHKILAFFTKQVKKKLLLISAYHSFFQSPLKLATKYLYNGKDVYRN